MNENTFNVKPSVLKGELKVPPSKSHTLRAIFFAALASGRSRIHNFLQSPDTEAMIRAVCAIGAQVRIHEEYLEIAGCDGNPSSPSNVIDCGNSGIVLRFMGALTGLLPHYTVLTGDESIVKSRPVAPLLDALQQLGAFAQSMLSNGHAPVIIKGPLKNRVAVFEGEDSQPVSGLLIAAAFASESIELHVKNPGEKPWIELTLDWFRRVGIPYQRSGYTYYKLEGKAKIKAFTYEVPGDFSSAAFPLAAAVITRSHLTVHGVDMNDSQGDKAIVALLEKMGADLTVDSVRHTITVAPCKELRGITIDVNDCIDALPILAVLGCFARGYTEIRNGRIARKKESDRIASITFELRKMGAVIEERPDGMVIKNSVLQGAEVYGWRDHRLALALTVAALGAETGSKIVGIDCIKKTYPSFYKDFTEIGANL